MRQHQQHDDPQGGLWEAMKDRRHIISQMVMSLFAA
jgi:hypothetical protein